MSDTFDTYYDLLPYHSFRDLKANEEENMPGEEEFLLEEGIIPEEMLETLEAGEIKELEDLWRLYTDEPPHHKR